MSDKLNLTDGQTRERLETELDYSFFVEAGAGAGKTTTLINRIKSLVMAGKAKPEEIVAITFTEAAASELKEKLFNLLQDTVKDPQITKTKRDNLKYAVDHIEDFVLSTIHGFAHQILFRYSTEANIPMSFKILSNDYEIYRNYEEIYFKIIQNHSELLFAIQKAYGNEGFNVDERVRKLISLLSKKNLRTVEINPIQEILKEVKTEILDNTNRIEVLITKCTDISDTLYSKTGDILHKIRTGFNQPDEAAYSKCNYLAFSELGSINFKVGNCGDKRNWPDEGKSELIAEIKDLQSKADRFKSQLLKLLVFEVVNELVSLQNSLLSAGYLSFDDLLSCSVRLLTENKSVRREIGKQFKYIAVDEYQDTDDLQFRLLELIATGSKETKNDLKLFYVGDPKQSIYAFRNADLDLYQTTKKYFDENNGSNGYFEMSALSSNFRSQAPIIDWVNLYLKELFSLDPKFDSINALVATKSAYPIEIFKCDSSRKVFYMTYKDDRLDNIDASDQEAQKVQSSTEPTKKNSKSNIGVDTLRRYSSELIARTIRFLVDSKARLKDNSEPVSFGDIAIIVPTRTAISQIASALEKYSIPIKYELKSDIFKSSIIKSVRYLLKVILDPTDLLSWTGLLQDLPNCLNETELYNFIEKFNGPENFKVDPTLSDNKIIRLVLKYNKLCQKLPFDQVFDEILEVFYLTVSALFYANYRDEISKLNDFVYIIYEFVQSDNPTLAKVLNWIDYLEQNSTSFDDALILEDDYDAVRLVTIHAAKGLEYGVVFLTGLKNLEQTTDNNAVVDCEIGNNGEYNVEVQFTNECFTKVLKQTVTDYEAIRKLYVAVTRAKDLLFVDFTDCYQLRANNIVDANSSKEESKPISIVSRLYNSIPVEELIQGDVENFVSDFTPTELQDGKKFSSLEVDVDEITRQVHQRKSEVDRRLTENRIVTPSKLNKKLTLAQIANSIEDEKLKYATVISVSSRGLMGTRTGTAVHKVLELLDFGRLDSKNTVESQSYIENLISLTVEKFEIESQARAVQHMVKHALESDCVNKAMKSKYYKEIYIGIPILCQSGRKILLEGFVDLLIETCEGLVVVDFKTTGLKDEADFEDLAKDYEPQGVAYAYGISKLTGKKVKEVIFLMLNENGWREIKISSHDLEDKISSFPSWVDEFESGI